MSGSLQHATPLIMRDVPWHRVCDGAFWYLALLADRKTCTVAVLFEKLLPALNMKPLLANWATLNGQSPSAPSSRLGDPAMPFWASASTASVDGSRADPHNYDLATVAATAALQLSAEGDPSVAADADESGAGHTPAGIELMLQHMLLLLSHADLNRLGHLKPGSPPVPPDTLELLWRATKRCSASTAARVVGATTMTPDELRCMQSELISLKEALGSLRRSRATVLQALPPPETSELKGSDRLPNFARLRDVEPKENLAGEQVERPLVMPVQLSLVPDCVSTVGEASNALQHACYVRPTRSNRCLRHLVHCAASCPVLLLLLTASGLDPGTRRCARYSRISMASSGTHTRFASGCSPTYSSE